MVGLALFLFLSPLFLASCGEPKSQTPTQYAPKYSADQIIAVVRAKTKHAAIAWKSFSQEPISSIEQYKELKKNYRLVYVPTEISVSYVGGTTRAWRATIKAPEGYYCIELTSRDATSYRIYHQAVEYFWETDGSLHIWKE